MKRYSRIKRLEMDETWKSMPIIGILRNVSEEDILAIVPNYMSVGMKWIEVTLNSQGSLEAISKLRSKYNDGLYVGAGTVCDKSDLRKALNAGAQFIVTPIVNEEVIRVCVELEIPVFPGAMTSSEIWKAWSLGATMVKIFPAGSLGVNYVKDILGPLDQIKLLATGGMTLSNLQDFWNAGVQGFGVGSPLFVPELIKKADWEALSQHMSHFSNCVKTLQRK